MSDKLLKIAKAELAVPPAKKISGKKALAGLGLMGAIGILGGEHSKKKAKAEAESKDMKKEAASLSGLGKAKRATRLAKETSRADKMVNRNEMGKKMFGKKTIARLDKARLAGYDK